MPLPRSSALMKRRRAFCCGIVAVTRIACWSATLLLQKGFSLKPSYRIRLQCRTLLLKVLLENRRRRSCHIALKFSKASARAPVSLAGFPARFSLLGFPFKRCETMQQDIANLTLL